MTAMMPVTEQGGKSVFCVKQGVTLGGLNAGGMMPSVSSMNGAEVQELTAVITTHKSRIAAEHKGS